MPFTTDLNWRVLNNLLALTKHNFFSYKLTAVIVHKFKLNKRHCVVFVKSGSNWILHDNEMSTKKTSQKAVLETCRNSGDVEDQPLATMLIYTSLGNSSDYRIPPHLTKRYYKLFLHPKQEVILTVSSRQKPSISSQASARNVFSELGIRCIYIHRTSKREQSDRRNYYAVTTTNR